MAAHLATCAAAHDVKGTPQELITLRIEAADDPSYWIHLEVRAKATLKSLDLELRELWLECCGHMSAFFIGREEVDMGSVVEDVLGTKGAKLRYEYDFGSTTSLNARVLSKRRGSLGRNAIRILARNDPPAWRCMDCLKPATLVCSFCWDGGFGVLCTEHARKHEHADEGGYLPVVNSPRMGVCGYTGAG
ncbi:MAG: hypothetical protein ABI054_07670 [Planctomycetota bacterium]